VGLTTPPRKKSAVRKPKMWPRDSEIDYSDDWEKSIKEAKVLIGLKSHLRRRRRRRRRML
jgi:hypothetical protein